MPALLVPISLKHLHVVFSSSPVRGAECRQVASALPLSRPPQAQLPYNIQDTGYTPELLCRRRPARPTVEYSAPASMAAPAAFSMDLSPDREQAAAPAWAMDLCHTAPSSASLVPAGA